HTLAMRLGSVADRATSVPWRDLCGRALAGGGGVSERSSLCLARQLLSQLGHPQHGFGRMTSLVALVPARACERLLHRLAREHPKRARHTRGECNLLDAARRLGTDEVVMVGLATDHGPQTGHTLKAARVSRIARRQGQLERSGHVEHLDLGPGL